VLASVLLLPSHLLAHLHFYAYVFLLEKLKNLLGRRVYRFAV
jgi:hypothetical protein